MDYQEELEKLYEKAVKLRHFIEEGAELFAALEAENERLRNPWTYIVPDDAGTLPNTGRAVDISYVTYDDPAPQTFVAFYYGSWKYVETGRPVSDAIMIYAWRERPDPAPYPSE